MAADVKIGEIFQLKRTEGIWVLYINAIRAGLRQPRWFWA
jgi:hypothetical protein